MRAPLLRWGVRAALAVGVATSVAANILHARPETPARIIAGWAPFALLVCIELISRVPTTRRLRTGVRITATTVVAGIAAWVSYWHMAAVAARYGEDAVSAHLLPLSVDGLIVVASVTLVELGVRAAADPARTQVTIVDATPDELAEQAAVGLERYYSAVGKPFTRDAVRETLKVGAEKAGRLKAVALSNGNGHEPTA